MSRFGFGTYRISDMNPSHIEALREAIQGGVTIIDTSTNYLDGSAERAIGLALASFDDKIVQNIEIISKVGYIQGSNLREYHRAPFEGVVKYSPECYYSIEPEFIHDQLSESLNRLESKKISCYLLHNPEYYLLDAINRGVDRDERLDDLYSRIYKAFVALENEVAQGRIDSYGISSNSFSLKHGDEAFLPYEDLITLAQSASADVGNEKHSFSTIQLPVNLLEQEGLKCAKWAKRNGLRVIANRPLNAIYEGGMVRLSEYDESNYYYNYLNELLEICDNEPLRVLYNLIEELDASKHRFSWIGEYETFLVSAVMPHIKNSLMKIANDEVDMLLHSIELFLQEYRNMVAYECGVKSAALLKKLGIQCHRRLQECALNFLLEQNDIDCILVGMRRSSYVSDILAFEEEIA